VVLAHRPDAWIAHQDLPAGVTRLHTTVRRTRDEMRRVAAELQRLRIDVIHSHLSSAHFFGVLQARLFGCRVVATSHSARLQPHWWWNDRVICPSEATARFQRWVNLVPRSRIDVIHNFVNPGRFQPRRTRAAIRAEHRLSDDDFVIAIVGEVNARKASHVLVQALPQLVRQGLSPRVLLVGATCTKYEPLLHREIGRAGMAGRVAQLGMRSDVADLLHAADVICLPSNSEVMPIALLEGMSCGLPAVGTRVGGVPECVRDGVDGFLVPPRAPALLAEKLAILARDPALRQRLGQQARARVLETFSPQACVARIEHSYALACARPLAAAG
jgi:glycosyltransferase involved in cell wall biosynthesis